MDLSSHHFVSLGFTIQIAILHNISGIGGSLFSALFIIPANVSVGASGAIMSLV
uniref:Peptidase S54 rhomboid domain-containing protein n=1 Tax=Medicago truncatula TaxID=3880 RepID=A2Q2V4_MEDTR|nr:hypothetical protein MtrDRAFT_AC152185g45v2 [Medicago truncatula]